MNYGLIISSRRTPAIDPKPAYVLHPYFMPAAPDCDTRSVSQKPCINEAACLYRELKEDFNVSVTTLASWLGVKRRTLYNWLKKPEVCHSSGMIEGRLVNLKNLRNQMEVEHLEFLYKISESPIYGDPKLGELLKRGASDIALVEFYDDLFGQFESYKESVNSLKVD